MNFCQLSSFSFFFILFFFSPILSQQKSIKRSSEWELYHACHGWNSVVVAAIHVCHDHKIAFLHIYKSSSTSIGRMIQDICASSGYYGNFLPTHPQTRVSQVVELSEKGYFIFTIVRDPIERFLSSYHELGIRGKTKFDPQISRKENFRFFFDSVMKQLVENEHTMDGLIIPQSCFVKYESSTLPLNLVLNVEHINLLPVIIKNIINQTNIPTRTEDLVNSHNIDHRFMVKDSELSREEYRALCILYKSDYIHFGFQIPKECIPLESLSISQLELT